MKRLQVIFSGHVQGVGFRYTVDRIARHFEVTGYVKNLPSEQVELVGEGDEIVLNDFLQAVIESPMQRHILEKQVVWSEVTGNYKVFGIAH
ncbi:MAG: acylphosphatase [Candidatus Omnitrophica bacterium]|nr:acylphosphatase [Candidatus Omnitrophota bacterium]